ncbi:hypothetical protein [Aliamphritea spongicola]|nr:hypothetical protein [Aliamphritea spongicola]
MIWQREYGLGEEDHVEIRFGKGDWQVDDLYPFPRQTCFPVCTPEIAAQLNSPADIFNFNRWETQGSADRWENWLSYADCEAQGSQPVHSTSTFVVSMDMARRGWVSPWAIRWSVRIYWPVANWSSLSTSTCPWKKTTTCSARRTTNAMPAAGPSATG